MDVRENTLNHITDEISVIYPTSTTVVKRATKSSKRCNKLNNLIQKIKRKKSIKKMDNSHNLISDKELIVKSLKDSKELNSSTSILNEQKKSSKEFKTNLIEKLNNSLINGLNICIDLSYESSHSERELSSLSKQLRYAYSIVKKSSASIHLHLSSISSDSYVYQSLKRYSLTLINYFINILIIT